MFIHVIGNTSSKVFFFFYKSIVEVVKHRELFIKRIKLFLRTVFFYGFMVNHIKTMAFTNNLIQVMKSPFSHSLAERI